MHQKWGDNVMKACPSIQWSLDGVCAWGHRMVSADEITDLWPPTTTRRVRSFPKLI